MLNIDQHARNKERILAMIKIRGPSLPVQIARDIGVSLLFASAFLSEMKDEGKLKMSGMRIGSSPLYYLSGQENMLENFINFLNQREKEALAFLKREGVLEDEKLEPVVRVALRAIRDFAFPVRIRADNDAKIFWKYFALNDDEAEEMIKTRLLKIEEKKEKKIKSSISSAALSPSPPSVSQTPSQINLETGSNKFARAPAQQSGGEINEPEKVELELKQEILKSEKKKEKKAKKEFPQQVLTVQAPPILTIPTTQEKEQKKSKVKKQEESEFANGVRDYLAGKDIEILKVFNEKKKEFEGKLRIDTLFGKQEFYFVAKDKKNLGDNDFAVALQRAQAEKVPAIVLAAGEVSKKGKEYLEQWKNLVKFEKIKI